MLRQTLCGLRCPLFTVSLLAGVTIPALAQVPAGDVRIHYHRADGNYSGWALYTWNASTENNSWCQSEVAVKGTDSFGVYFDVSVNATQGTPAGQLGFIINNCNQGGAKDPGPNQYLQVTEYSQGWVISGNVTVFYSQPPTSTNPIPAGDVRIHYHRPDGNYTGWGRMPGTRPRLITTGVQASWQLPEPIRSASTLMSP